MKDCEMKKVQNLVMDLETISTSKRAVVVSCGIASIYRNAEGVWQVHDDRKIYTLFDSVWQIAAGRDFDTGTRNWWKSACPEAYDEYLKSFAYEEHPLETLRGLERWVKNWYGDMEIVVWGNGPSFDNAIYADLCKHVGIPIFWKFSNEGCVRTAHRMMRSVPRPEPAIKHHGYWDAHAEAQWLCDISNALPEGVTLLEYERD